MSKLLLFVAGFLSAGALLFAVLALFFSRAADARVQGRGYQNRPSGFDLNFDGVIGEAGDCQICRGGATDADIDGNGVPDRQIYVHQDYGADDVSCGAPGSPCRTVEYALNGRNAAFADRVRTPSPKQIQAICVAGTGQPSALNPPVNGAEGSYTRAATGTQVRHFEYPRYPLMIVGWDHNANGVYPPYDTEDVAVFDGDLFGQTERAFDAGASRFELAHLTIRDYGLNCPAGEFVTVSLLHGSPAHVYVHDVIFSEHSVGCTTPSSNAIVIETYTRSARYVAIENNWFRDIGGFIIHRGSAASQSGPARFQHNTYDCRSCNAVFKTWGLWSGIEVLDNRFDGHSSTNPGARGIIAAQCTQDWAMVNNEFLNFGAHALHLQPYAAGACASRPLTGIRFDRNEVRQTAASSRTATAILVDGQGEGAAPEAHVGQFTISNNFISTDATPRWQSAILVDGGHAGSCTGDITGAYEIVNNTISASVNTNGFYPGVIRFANLHRSTCRQQDITFRNNIVVGLNTGDAAVHLDYAPANFSADYNIYPPDGTAQWVWNGASQDTLAAWRSASGGDQNSKQCVPIFLDASNGNFRLTPRDTCAVDAGTRQSSITSVDIDGQSRPQGLWWDIGAPEATFAKHQEHRFASGTPIHQTREKK